MVSVIALPIEDHHRSLPPFRLFVSRWPVTKVRPSGAERVNTRTRSCHVHDCTVLKHQLWQYTALNNLSKSSTHIAQQRDPKRSSLPNLVLECAQSLIERVNDKIHFATPHRCPGFGRILCKPQRCAVSDAYCGWHNLSITSACQYQCATPIFTVGHKLAIKTQYVELTFARGLFHAYSNEEAPQPSRLQGFRVCFNCAYSP